MCEKMRKQNQATWTFWLDASKKCDHIEHFCRSEDCCHWFKHDIAYSPLKGINTENDEARMVNSPYGGCSPCSETPYYHMVMCCETPYDLCKESPCGLCGGTHHTNCVERSSNVAYGHALIVYEGVRWSYKAYNDVIPNSDARVVVSKSMQWCPHIVRWLLDGGVPRLLVTIFCAVTVNALGFIMDSSVYKLLQVLLGMRHDRNSGWL